MAPKDFISSMPDIVITDILDRLPLQDAVRTSVLAKNWRFKWTLLSQLVFDQSFFAYLSQTQGKNNYVRIISRLLRSLTGAVTKFVLSIDEHGYPVLRAKDINFWISTLSRKGIKELILMNRDETALMLRTHLFSCLELTHLELYNCWFDLPSSFHGFPNLVTLDMVMVPLESNELKEFITSCPLLAVLNIGYLFPTGSIKVVEIAKLENLKVLSLSLCDLDPVITSSSTIFDLLGSLPKLEVLHLDFLDCKLTECGAKGGFPTAFPCLKVLTLSKINIDSDIMVSCFFEMIRSFPNLQALEISTYEYRDSSWTPPICFPDIDYNTMGMLLQLQIVIFTYYKPLENEVCLVKYLLACSPLLEEIVVRTRYPGFISSDERFSFAKKLLKLHRASSVAEIDLS